MTTLNIEDLEKKSKAELIQMIEFQTKTVDAAIKTIIELKAELKEARNENLKPRNPWYDNVVYTKIDPSRWIPPDENYKESWTNINVGKNGKEKILLGVLLPYQTSISHTDPVEWEIKEEDD